MSEKIEFHDLESQMQEIMGYYETIRLTPEQVAIKEEVLGGQPVDCHAMTTEVSVILAALLLVSGRNPL